MTYLMLYPEKRHIEDKQIIGWAQDAMCEQREVAGCEVGEITVREAIDFLEDLGLISLGNGGKPLEVLPATMAWGNRYAR